MVTESRDKGCFLLPGGIVLLLNLDGSVRGVWNLTPPPGWSLFEETGDVGVDEDTSEALAEGQVDNQINGEAQVVKNLKHHLQGKMIQSGFHFGSNRLFLAHRGIVQL